MNNLNISELVSTRISHDLIGNIGAFANAVELLEDEDDEFMDEIKSSLKISSDILSARLKFFRMAFGIHSNNLSKIDLVTKTIADYVASLNINYPITFESQFISVENSRYLMLCAMIAADTIIRGGRVMAKQEGDNLVVCADSDSPLSQPKIDTMKKLLSGMLPSDNLSLYAPLFFLLELLPATGKTLQIEDQGSFALIIK